MTTQAEIHEMVSSEDVDQRKRAAALLRENFSRLTDRETAWKDLIRLTGDEDRFVRWGGRLMF